MRRIGPILTLGLLCLAAHPTAGYAAPSDPAPGSPSGAVYELPLERGRSDAAPKGPGAAPGAGGGAQSGSFYRSENNFGSSAVVPGLSSDSSAGAGSESSAASGAGGGGSGGGEGGSGGSGAGAADNDGGRPGTSAAPASSAAPPDTGSTSTLGAFALLGLILVVAGAVGAATARARRLSGF